MTSKKLLSVMLALVFALSLVVALPVSADATVTATVNGSAVNSGDTISATASLELTLSQAVTDAATQIVFQEYNNLYDSTKLTTYGEEWHARRNIATMNDAGTVLSVTFPAGFLNYGSKYRFAFDLDAEAEGYEAEFIFVADTDATYYFVDDFSRYPAGNMQPLVANQYNAATNKHFSGSFPWGYMGYYGYCPIFVVNGAETGHETYMRVRDTMQNGCGVDLHGAYLNKVGAGTTIKGQVDATIKITAKDLSDMYSVGIVGLYYNNDTSWDVYVRTKNTLGNNSTSAQNTETLYGDFEKVATVNFDSAEEAAGWHTISYCDNQTVSNSNLVTSHNVWHIELDGKTVVSTTTGWAGATLNTSGTASQTGDFVNVGSTFGSRIFDGVTVDSTDTTYSEMYVDKISFKTFVAEPLTVANTNNTYATNGKISYTLSKPVNAGTVTADTLVLEQQYNDAWYPMDSMEFATVSADKTTIELNFADGDLTPEMNYRVSLTDDLVALDGGAMAAATEPIVFTATDKDDYLVYENFERFPLASIHGGTDLKCQAFKGLQPFYLQAGWIGNASSSQTTYPSKIGETDGDKFMCVAGANPKMISYRFNNDATGSLPEGESSHLGVAEFTFAYDAAATANNLLIFGGIALQRDTTDNTKWNIYYQSSAFGYNSNAYQVGGNSNIAAFTKLGTWTTSAALDAKHVLKLETYNTLKENANGSVVDYQILKAISLDGANILTNEIGNGLMLASNSISAAGINGIHWRNNVGDTTVVAVAKPDEATAVTVKANLNLYEYKYYNAIDVEESAQTSADGITFSITNRTNANITALPVLAVYDGTQLVEVKGLNGVVATYAKGETATCTLKPDDMTAGYSYKFMLLNSKNGLQPLWYATKGTIE